MQPVGERFNEYVRIDTRADPQSQSIPSSGGQQRLLERLAAELTYIGLTPHLRPGLLLVRIQARPGYADAPRIGFIAHVDTSPELSGAAVPVVHDAYDGRDLVLPDDPAMVLRASEQPALASRVGHDIITASGTTLLGADDKAGVAIIMTLAERLFTDNFPHGPVSLAFTTDEEIGRGADGFDLDAFGATAAYTLDGGGVGELEVENFNADEMVVTFDGFNTHPGYPQGRMANALRALGRFLAALPAELSPERTAERDGFIHPHAVDGGVERASAHLILRDFELDGLARQAAIIEQAARDAASSIPGVTATCRRQAQYRNMRDRLAAHPHVAAYAEEAIRQSGLEVVRRPIRGGTDGARLTEMGLPTPNLFAGQHNIHSRLEWVSVQDMEKAVEVCVHLCRRWAESQVDVRGV